MDPGFWAPAGREDLKNWERVCAVLEIGEISLGGANGGDLFNIYGWIMQKRDPVYGGGQKDPVSSCI